MVSTNYTKLPNNEGSKDIIESENSNITNVEETVQQYEQQNLHDGNNDIEIQDFELPSQPPDYGFNSSDMININFEDADLTCVNRSFHEKLKNLGYDIHGHLRSKFIDPLFALMHFFSEKLDLYLNKVGNPLILRRFLYIIFMGAVALYVLSSDYMSNTHTRGARGLFSDHSLLLDYAKKSIDLAKFENDLEYISSMPHMSGTKGDIAIKNYISASFQNNGLKLVKEHLYGAYSNYPKSQSLRYYINGDIANKFDIKLTKNNFNPLSAHGTVLKTPIIYGSTGTESDFKNLKENGLLSGKYIILLDYGKVISEQVLLAQKYNATGIIFISKEDVNNPDSIQQRSVGIEQYSNEYDSMSLDSSSVPASDATDKMMNRFSKIPTLPISYRDGRTILQHLSIRGIKFSNGKSSGTIGDVLVDLAVETDVKENHFVSDIIGKFEGREQTDKAIVLLASRSSLGYGAKYPNYGTAMLLSLLELFQEMKYKYNWKPLRNIYFISTGGNEFNHAGSTMLVKQKLKALKDEIYTVIDISQIGIENDNRDINIQAHPLLQSFFKNKDISADFNITLTDIEQYGDWFPFMTVGIPSIVIADPAVQNRGPSIESQSDTFESLQTMLHKDEKTKQTSDTIYFILKIAFKLINEPLIHMDISDHVIKIDSYLKDIVKNYSRELNVNKVTEGLLLWKSIGTEWENWKRGWENVVWTHGQGLEPSLLSINRWTWNKKLANIGRRQCYGKGIPGRQYHKNVLFGPTLFTESFEGNGWVFPGVMDAIYENNWKEAQKQMDIIGEVLKYSAKYFIEETNIRDY
ncbi:hypothetical protein TPHA_0G01460 [Tetrapisispora phaffii CBS 4417]|uniref:Transferrin receptor-like dimerisation domain-containing protein n=1 Tax=Tetrapisispora phaffii (strain ATCC 24235 / CBS 4417 / NBRC 1672 / NRRL Y-8282 / UCD 70-5) TaxID=1071381 RepID=G8BVQ5_TETPH|nr:hypothetical protein TPHA_0G01460 [Tetrapisispora phaffii CBS 4417]CCE63983.1 hypothetical protein TPHA_0G01460 [Tetrapisispora phaffii CBS 4417]